MKNWFYYFIFLLIFSCQSEKNQSVIGNWKFVKAENNKSNKKILPTDIKQNIEIEFTTYGEMKKRMNGSLQQSIPYSFQDSKLILNGAEITFKFKEDTLLIYPDYSVGYIDYYVRNEKKLK